MDIALDARTETRQGMPGHDFLMARAGCSKATLYRRLQALVEAGLLVVARKSAPGMRAVYGIPVLHVLPHTGLTTADTRSDLSTDETRPSAAGLARGETRSGLAIGETRPSEVIHNGSQKGGQRVSKIGERVSPLLNPTPSVPPSSFPRHNSGLPLRPPEVEGSGGGQVKNESFLLTTRAGTDAERQRQADLLTAWQRESAAADHASNGATL